jgi:hypothetical protein
MAPTPSASNPSCFSKAANRISVSWIRSRVVGWHDSELNSNAAVADPAAIAENTRVEDIGFATISIALLRFASQAKKVVPDSDYWYQALRLSLGRAPA